MRFRFIGACSLFARAFFRFENVRQSGDQVGHLLVHFADDRVENFGVHAAFNDLHELADFLALFIEAAGDHGSLAAIPKTSVVRCFLIPVLFTVFKTRVWVFDHLH